MSRREFIAFLIGGAGASFRAAAWAQSPQQVRRVGVLLPFDENDSRSEEPRQTISSGHARFGLDRRT